MARGLLIRNIIGRRLKDTLAERLRRRPAEPMGSPRVGSNPTGVVLAGIQCAHTKVRKHKQILQTWRAPYPLGPAGGHAASNAPDLSRPPKLSGARPGYYWCGGPPGKTSGCCQLCVRALCALGSRPASDSFAGASIHFALAAIPRRMHRISSDLRS